MEHVIEKLYDVVMFTILSLAFIGLGFCVTAAAYFIIW